MENPLLSLGRPLPFASIAAHHVVPALRALIAEADQKLARLDPSRATYEDTLAVLDTGSERLDLAVNIVDHLEGVATTDELREAYNAILPEISAFRSSIPLRENVWQALLAFADTDAARALAPTERRLLDKTLADFRREGATLDAAGKERLAAIDRELALITTKFAQNVLDATKAFELVLADDARLGGLPQSARDEASASARAKGQPGFRFTLQAPSVVAVLTYADDRALRQAVWQASNGRALGGAFDNSALIADILRLRKEKANLLGFAHFADLVTEDRMARSGAGARRFIDELTQKTEAAFRRENQELLAFRKSLEGPDAPPLEPWDIGYYAEKLRRERYALDEEELRQYFPAERALAGAFQVAERLFGVRVRQVSGLPTWDPHVTVYSIRDADDAELGTFYVDLYTRENKRGGAWMHGLWAATPPDPHVAVFCANVSPPLEDKPALLTHRDVETLFHEFGHLLHHCLSRVNVRSLACTHVAQDFVELPSQIMENWCSEREALSLFAGHFQSSQPIPEHLLEQLRAARTFRAANAQMRQLGFAAVDLALHVDYDPARDGDVMAYGRAILARFASAALPAGYGMLASFQHLFGSPVGYAAGYYSYKWAEVLDADAFSRFRSEGVLSSRVGAEFRDRVLCQGDSRDPMELFKSFMGREPRPEALLERQGLAA